MKAGLIFLIIFGPPALLLLSFIVADGIKKLRAKRRKERWRNAREAARWEVITESDGAKVTVNVGRVARVKKESQVLDRNHIGTVYLDFPELETKVLELRGKAYELVMTLNSL